MSKRSPNAKLWSGRYALALAACFSIVLFTIAVFWTIITIAGQDDPQVHPLVLAVFTAVSGAISGTIGFYFGQKSAQPKPTP